jgi:hypothetical protein
MPTLEDTAVDFPVTTLNDLLEVEAKAGVTVGADEDKYRRWAFISSAAAGLLAIALVVVLLTDAGGGGDGGAAKAKDYPGKPVKQTVKLATNVTSDIQVGKEVSLYKGSELVVAPVIVSQIINPKEGSLETSQSVELAMDEAQSTAFVNAFPKASDKGRLQIYLQGQPTAPPPPGAAPDSTAPAPTTETTVPPAPTESTTPASTPPATG